MTGRDMDLSARSLIRKANIEPGTGNWKLEYEHLTTDHEAGKPGLKYARDIKETRYNLGTHSKPNNHRINYKMTKNWNRNLRRQQIQQKSSNIRQNWSVTVEKISWKCFTLKHTTNKIIRSINVYLH